MKRYFVEFNAGSCVMSKEAKKKGFITFTVDWEQFENIDLVADIGGLNISNIPFIPDVFWMSPDCKTYSIAACSTHRNLDKSPKSEYAYKCDNVNRNAIRLIKEWLIINPNLIFFIENPRGNLRHMDFMKEFKRYTVWYCQYGDKRAKPTDIFTNSKTWIARPECKNYRYDKEGNIINRHCHHESARRGARTGTQGMKEFDRSKLPKELCIDIINSL